MHLGTYVQSFRDEACADIAKGLQLYICLAAIWSLKQLTNSVVVKEQIVHCNISMSIVK